MTFALQRGAIGLLLGSMVATSFATPTKDAMLTLLAQREAFRDVPFSEVVLAASGHRVFPVDPKAHAGILSALGTALDAATAAIDAPTHPIHDAGRINEASHFLEDEIRRQIDALPGWTCTVPRTSAGAEQRAGYPDLRIQPPGGPVIYLDPKLYARGTERGSLRSFYYEPKALTGKIHDDAIHLLAGFAHTGTDARSLRIDGWTLVDLSGLPLQLKAEFQASNRELYEASAVVGRSR